MTKAQLKAESCSCPTNLSIHVFTVLHGHLLVLRHLRIVAKSAYYFNHVRPSVCMYQPDSQWTDFRVKFDIYMKICQENSNFIKISGTLHEDLSTFFIAAGYFILP
jgi:hypothetical protein